MAVRVISPRAAGDERVDLIEADVHLSIDDPRIAIALAIPAVARKFSAIRVAEGRAVLRDERRDRRRDPGRVREHASVLQRRVG